MDAQSSENQDNLNSKISSATIQNVNPKNEDKVTNVYENLLGKLLTYLRQNKLMTLLILCRQITKIEINESVAEIYAENEILDELANEKNKIQMESYFKSIGLGIKYMKTQKEENKLNELRYMLGDKLKIN